MCVPDDKNGLGKGGILGFVFDIDECIVDCGRAAVICINALISTTMYSRLSQRSAAEVQW